MKQKRIPALLGFTLSAIVLSGCALSPETSMIRLKKEAQANAAEYETDISENPSSVQHPSGTTLRTLTDAPGHYQNSFESDSGRLLVMTDADVEIPEAGQVTSVTVSQHELNQDGFDKITEIFFPEAVFYTDSSYLQMTKSDWQKQIDNLKKYIVDGNLDPYYYGTDENGNYIFDIEKTLKTYESHQQNAPEEKELVEIKPQFGLEEDMEEFGTFVHENDFSGIASTPDGLVYYYTVQGNGAVPMNVRIERHRERSDMNLTPLWSAWQSMKLSEAELPEEDALIQEIGITLEEARGLAEEKVEKLGLSYMELKDWDYGILWEAGDGGGYSSDLLMDTGYLLHYTRKINGIPVTYTLDGGGALEDMDSEYDTWGYETLDFIITKDGLDTVNFCNQYEVDAISEEALTLLPFSEILEIYEKIIKQQNSYLDDADYTRTYHINRITLGYTRIYDPTVDSTTGTLVPVWDFFGSFEDTPDNGIKLERHDYLNALAYQSFLTVNAVDGSIINRSLGY